MKHDLKVDNSRLKCFNICQMKLNLQNTLTQYWVTFILIALVTGLGSILNLLFEYHTIGYHTIGYIYLLSVILVSALFKMGPIFFSAILSALCWNFFFLTPQFSFHISDSDDWVMYYTFFIVASLGGYFNIRIRKNENLLVVKEESERLYQTLINSISHEIRTPLTAVLGNAAALQQKELQKDPEFIASTAKELKDASERLNQVVENLLDMSRIESGHLILKREVFAMNDLLEHSLLRLRPQLIEHEVMIEHHEKQEWDDLISGDFKLLDHAIGNLLLNASRYSPKNTKIKIVLRSDIKTVILEISDQGPGILSEFHDKVFEKFFRIPGTPTGGVGLGLSIVRGILEAHSAKIKLIDSSEGAKFELSFLKAKLPEAIKGSLT